MTHLAIAINRLLLEHDLRASWVTERVRLNPGYLSRLRSGKQSGISPPLLGALAQVLGKNKSERAEIIAAHMKDESCGYCPGIITLYLDEHPEIARLDPDLEYLQSHMDDSDLRTAIKSLIALHRAGNKHGNTNGSAIIFKKRKRIRQP